MKPIRSIQNMDVAMPSIRIGTFIAVPSAHTSAALVLRLCGLLLHFLKRNNNELGFSGFSFGFSFGFRLWLCFFLRFGFRLFLQRLSLRLRLFQLWFLHFLWLACFGF